MFSLEETLGANWLNKLGIVILVIGLAFFLALKLQTWGPGGKVLCGYAISVLLLGGGILLERRPPYRVFARAIMGGGWALGFFTTFAMYHLEATRLLHSLAADLVLMLIVAAGMVAHSLRYRSQTVTGLAFLLGFATLLTSHVEAANDTVVFSLTASAVLAIALVVVTTIRHWAVLELLGLLSVYFSHLVWLTRVLPQNHAPFTEFWPSTALILLYWLIFRLAYVLRTPLDKNEENISSVSAVFNSGGVLGLLKFQSAHPEWAFWALLALGCLEMALAFWSRPKRRQAFVVLSTIATVLLIASVPFRFHGVSWPILWLVQAQVLAICGLRLGEPVFRRLGLLAGLATGAVLAFHDVLPLALFRLDYPDPSRHWSLTAGLTLAALLYWVHAEVYTRRWPQIVENANEAFALKITSWLGLAAAARRTVGNRSGPLAPRCLAGFGTAARHCRTPVQGYSPGYAGRYIGLGHCSSSCLPAHCAAGVFPPGQSRSQPSSGINRNDGALGVGLLDLCRGSSPAFTFLGIRSAPNNSVRSRGYKLAGHDHRDGGAVGCIAESLAASGLAGFGSAARFCWAQVQGCSPGYASGPAGRVNRRSAGFSTDRTTRVFQAGKRRCEPSSGIDHDAGSLGIGLLDLC